MTVVFAEGATTTTINISISFEIDTEPEGPENFQVVLLATGGTELILTAPNATVIIQEGQCDTTLPTHSINSLQVMS